MEIVKHLKDRIQGKAGKGQRRSGKWSALRKIVLQTNTECAVCGNKKGLEVHHAIPFHIDPSKELLLDNLIVLCERGIGHLNCHLIFGHIGNYKKANQNVREDARYWRTKFR